MILRRISAPEPITAKPLSDLWREYLGQCRERGWTLDQARAFWPLELEVLLAQLRDMQKQR
jgi:hypothetical protein